MTFRKTVSSLDTEEIAKKCKDPEADRGSDEKYGLLNDPLESWITEQLY